MPTPSSLIGEIDGRDCCDADSDWKIRVPARVWGREEKLKKLKEGGGNWGRIVGLFLDGRPGSERGFRTGSGE